MSVHSRVADEPNEEFLEFVTGGHIPRFRTKPLNYLVVKRGKKYRVHHDNSSYSYSGPTGAHVKIGAMVKRYDPDAGDKEGKAAAFDTPDEAIAYIKRWL